VAEIHAWWLRSREQRRTCILYAYSLGKAHRVLAALDASLGPILVHGAVAALLPAYRAAGVKLPQVEHAGLAAAKSTRGRALVIAPPLARQPAWLRKFGPVNQAVASGWMQIRGLRRRQALDRGFALSDHADWAGLNTAIDASQAEEVWLTHGSTGAMVRWLVERGIEARAIPTPFGGESDEPIGPDDGEAPAAAGPEV
jgi:putative mRNA 3-end processing factor